MARHKNPFAAGGRGGGGPTKDPQLVWQQAVAATKAGNHAQAEKLLRQFVKAAGPRPDALRALAAAQSQLGKHLEAIKTIERACKSAPDNTQLLLTQGGVLLQAGRGKEARKVYQRILALKDEGSGWDHFNLALAWRAEGEQDEAEASFRKALEIDESLVRARHELATVLATKGENEEAARQLRICVEQDPKLLAGWLTLGGVERNRGRHEEALAAFERAAEIQPNFPPCHSNRGQVLRELGRNEAAIEALEKALALVPDDGPSRVMLAMTRKYRERSAETAWMEKTARGKGPRPPAGSHPIALFDAQFAYAKMLRDMGDEDAWFTWLNKANATKRKTLDYDVDDDIAVLRRLPGEFTPEVLAEAAQAGGCTDPTPIFVCGMPRSGTTLVESILNANPAIFGAGELGYASVVCRADEALGGTREPEGGATAPAESLLRAGEEYVRLIRLRDAQAERIVDKMPLNSVRVGTIRRMLPNAKILLMRRDARDVGLSNYQVNFETGQHFSYDLRDLGRYHRAHDALLDHWAAHVGKDALYEVQYQRLVDDFEAEVRRICEFLGVTWDDRMLHFHEVDRAVVTASLEQVRSPVYKSSVGRWKRYEKELAPLLEALEEPLEGSAP